MKKFIFILFAITIATGVAIVPKGIMSNNSSSVLLSNIEAFAGANPEQINGLNFSQDTCAAHNYLWNALLDKVNSGSDQIQCVLEGEINLFGQKISGPFGLGRLYAYDWASYYCKSWPGQCCDMSQGIIYRDLVRIN